MQDVIGTGGPARLSGPVMVGYDGTETGRDALVLGRLLAETTGGELVLARVFPVNPWHARHELPRETVDRARAAEEEVVLDLAELAKSVGARAEPVPGHSAAQGLHDLAEELGAGAVVVGSTHRGEVGRVLAGSTGERLLHGAPCGVALAPRGLREDHEASLRVIGLAYDGSAESRVAHRHAIGLALSAKATMRIFTVVAGAEGAGGEDERDRELYRQALEEALAAAPPELRAAGTFLGGDPARVIATEAQKGVDLLVLGSRGYGPLKRVLLGGVSLSLVRMAPCALLVLPRGADRAAPASPSEGGSPRQQARG